eukprot:1635805-Prymnesium_polylepis.1
MANQPSYGKPALTWRTGCEPPRSRIDSRIGTCQIRASGCGQHVKVGIGGLATCGRGVSVRKARAREWWRMGSE